MFTFIITISIIAQCIFSIALLCAAFVVWRALSRVQTITVQMQQKRDIQQSIQQLWQ